MSPAFVLVPGCSGWEIVDLRGGLPVQPLISGSLPSGAEPAAASAPADGRTPSIREKTQV